MHRTGRNRCHVSVNIDVGKQPKGCSRLHLFKSSPRFGGEIGRGCDDFELRFGEFGPARCAGDKKYTPCERIAPTRAADETSVVSWRYTSTDLGLPTFRRREPTGRQWGRCNID